MVLWGELLDPLDPQRCLVGPDSPPNVWQAISGSLYELVVAACRICPTGSRAEVLAGTARRFYRIPIQVR